jgi:RNA polymerase sigma factor (sigma-70 family)
MTDANCHDDRILVAAVQRNERGAFERMVKAHQGLAWHVIYRLVQHPEDTRELCQETFLRVHQRLHQYRGDSPLSGWIGQIAYHIGVRHLQRKRIPLESELDDNDGEDRFAQVADDLDMVGAHVDAQEQVLLDRGMQRLPPMQRLLLTLYHLDEMSIGDISAMTGQPEGTIKNSLFRARHRLRTLLQPHWEIAV